MSLGYNPLSSFGNYFAPHQVIFGSGASGRVGAVARSLGASKIIVITDPGIAAAGLTTGILDAIASTQLSVELFDGAQREPAAQVVDECARMVRRKKFDLIVGLGGGSCMDTAKMASVMATNPGSIRDYIGMDKLSNRGLPKILIPTTAGSGAEVSRGAGLTVEQQQTHGAVFSLHLLPEVAILDPMLTLNLPPQWTAETGMDALAHAVESYVSPNTTLFAEVLALKAVEMIRDYLPMAYAGGAQNLEARSNMLWAANFAGLAMASGRTGAAHALAFTLSTKFHLPHAKAISIMLPHVMSYNKSACPKKYRRLAAAMGADVHGLTDLQAARKAADWVLDLLAEFGISVKLTDYGITSKDLPDLIESGMRQAHWFVNNPRTIAEKDIEAIYSRAMAGC